MYEFYLDGLRLPVAPSKMTVKSKNQNKTLTLINTTQVNVLNDSGLSDISLDALLPAVRYGWMAAAVPLYAPSVYLDRFAALKAAKQPFSFTVYRDFPDGSSYFNTSLKVSLEDWTVTEDVKEGFDVKVGIKLKTFVPFGAWSGRTLEKAPSGKTVTVKEGDTLPLIVKWRYGDCDKLGTVASLNGISDLVRLVPGTVLMLE